MIKLLQVIHFLDTNSVEATWVDAEGAVVRCHSYADVQMDMLRADLGADASQHSDLIARVESAIKPSPPKTPEQVGAEIKAQILALEASQPRTIREALLTGDKTRLIKLDAEVSVLREKLRMCAE